MGITTVDIIWIITSFAAIGWSIFDFCKTIKRKKKLKVNNIRDLIVFIVGITGIVTRGFSVYDKITKRSERIIGQKVEEKFKGMVAVPSPLQDGVFEFVPKDEFEFGLLTAKGDSAFHRNNFTGAESLYTKAYELAEASRKGKLIGLALLGVGAAKGMQGDYEKAIKNLQEGLKYKKEIKDTLAISQIYYNLGVCFQIEKKLDGAIKNYDKAIELHPQYAEAFNNRGNTYADRGELDRAIADFNKAIALNPQYAAAFNNRGVAYYKEGELDRAIEDFNKAIELDPKYATAFNSRGNAYADRGEFDWAIADYNKAIELDPKDATAFYNLGIVYIDKGEFDKALENYTIATELNSKYVYAFINRGNTYADRGELDRAIADYNKAIEINPKCAVAMKNMGLAYERQGNKERAKYWYEQTLKYKKHLENWQIKEVQRWLKEL